MIWPASGKRRLTEAAQWRWSKEKELPLLFQKRLDRLESFRKDQDATKMKARMELVVGASAAQQRATSRLQCRQRAHSLLSCQTWTGFHQHQFLLLSKWFKIYLFSYRAIKTFGIKTPPPSWKGRRSNTNLNDIALSMVWFISPGKSSYRTIIHKTSFIRVWRKQFLNIEAIFFIGNWSLKSSQLYPCMRFLFQRIFLSSANQADLLALWKHATYTHCMSADHKNNKIKKRIIISHLILIY